MKKIMLMSLLITTMIGTSVSAQETDYSEKYGQTLNAGLGLGFYGYVDNLMPVLHANYELDVAQNFTLAPFITYYSYQNYHYWGNNNTPYKSYYYRVTAIPIGIKATYYFDQLFHANSRWDFYAAGSLGMVIRNTNWESGYFGDKTVRNGSSGLYLDLHIGTEYHLNNALGLFLDLSSGISTFGLAVHM